MFVERIIVLFKPEYSPPPSGEAEPALSADQARVWEEISSRFGRLALTPNSRGADGAYFTIDVPPGEDTVALLKALRLWDDLNSAQIEMQY
jgi:hypothetical protein